MTYFETHKTLLPVICPQSALLKFSLTAEKYMSIIQLRHLGSENQASKLLIGLRSTAPRHIFFTNPSLEDVLKKSVL